MNYRPGRRMSVRYRARVAWPGGRVTRTTLVASAQPGREPAVWRWPDDPQLPGARPATDPEFVRGLPGVPRDAVELSYRSYWPGRRAVLQGLDPASGEPRLFVKVVRPSAFDRIQRVHALLSDRLPVARPVGAAAELGILVLEPLPGRTISACLADPVATPPDPEELVALLTDLGSHELPPRPPRRTTAGKVAGHVRLLSHLLPDEAEALARFAELYGDDRPQPSTTVHADLHEEQVLAHDGRVTGLLDVDDAGPGELVDDLALLVARVHARARNRARGHARAHVYEDELLRAFDAAVDPAELRRRAAGALLGRAAAPFRAYAPNWRVAARERVRTAEIALHAWSPGP